MKLRTSAKPLIVSLVVLGSCMALSTGTVHAACPTLDTSRGQDTLSVSVPADGTYRVWSRLMAPDTTNNSFYLAVDSNCAVNVGDAASIPTNTWAWVNYQDGNTGSYTDVALTAGAHTLTLTGREDSVSVDRVILTTDTSCLPTGTGDNCVTTVSPVGAGPTVDASVNTIQDPAGTVMTAPALTTHGADVLVAYLSSDAPGTGAAFTSVSGCNLTWSNVARANKQAGVSEIWTATAPAALNNCQVAATRGFGSYTGAITVVGYSGASKVGAAATNSAVGAPSVNLTTTAANSYVAAVGNDYDAATARAVGNGQALLSQNLASSGDTFWAQALSVNPSTAGQVTINDTAPTGDQYNLAAVEILAAAATAPAPTPTPTADTTPPSVSLTSPANNTAVSGIVSLAASASDNVGVSKVIFSVNGQAVSTTTASPYNYAWNTAGLAPGNYSLTATAYDAAGNLATSTPVTVSIADTTAPAVAISSPAANSKVSSMTTIKGTATDNVSVSRLEIIIDGKTVATNSATTTISYSWNTKKLPRGNHTITINAYDAAGNKGTASETVYK